MTASETENRWRFGEFTLDAVTHELRRGGARVELEPKPLELLVLLARRRDRVVGKEEILALLWPDVVSSGDSLFYCVRKAREAVGDTGEQQAVIETLRGKGLRFVAEVILPPVPPMAATLAGREDVLARLWAAFEGARAGRGRAVFLNGPAGIGKSRLVAALSNQALASGADVLESWAYREAGAPDMWLWQRILETLVQNRGQEAIARLAGTWASALSGFLPHMDEFPAPARSGPLESAPQLYRAIGQVLRAMAAENTLVLTLDDLHDATAPALIALDAFLDQIESVRVLVVGVYTGGGLPVDHPLAATLARASRDEASEILSIEPLSRSASEQIARDELPFDPQPEFLELLTARGAGNPLLLRQICGQLMRSVSEPDAGQNPGDALFQAQLIAQLTEIPPTIERLIENRLAALSAPARRTLEIAALVGHEFSFELVARAARIDIGDLVSTIEEAGVVGLVGPEQVRAGCYTWADPMVRGVLIQALGSRRPFVHADIAAAIEELSGDASEPPLGELAFHFLQASAIGDARKAIDYGLRAAAMCRCTLALEQACHHYEVVVDLLEKQVPQVLELRFEAAMGLAETRRLLNDPAGAKEAANTASAFAIRLGDPASATDVQVGRSRSPDMRRTGTSLGEGFLDRALRQHSEPSVERSRLSLQLAMSVAGRPAFRTRAEALIESALADARQMGHADVLFEALCVLTRVHRIYGSSDIPTRLAVCEELIRLADARGDDAWRRAAHSLRITPLIEAGNLTSARDEIKLLQSLGGETDGGSKWTDLLYRPMHAILRGEFVEAEGDVQRFAEGLAPEEVSTPNVALYFSPLFALRREQNRLAELEDTAVQWVSTFPQFPLIRTVLALVYAETGRPGDARNEVEKLEANAFSELAWSEGWRAGAAVLTQVAYNLGVREWIPPLRRMLLPVEPYSLVIGNAAVFLGPTVYFLGLAAETEGDLPRAGVYFEQAVRRCDAIGAVPLATWARMAQARILLALGTRTGAEKAAQLISGVEETADALGMHRLRVILDLLPGRT